MSPAMTQARRIAETAHIAAIIGLVSLAVAIATRGGMAVGGYLFDATLNATARFNGIALVLITLLPAMLLYDAVDHLRRALRLFSKGEFFSAAVAHHVARAGRQATLAMVAMILIVPNLERWLRSRGGFDLRIEPEYFGLLAFALFVAVVGHVLTLATQLKAENDAFV